LAGHHLVIVLCQSCGHYGIDTARFAANPVILFDHGRSHERGSLPVANAVSYGPDRYKGRPVFVGTARFWEGDAFAERLFDRYASGEMRGWSVQCLPVEASPPTREEIRARGDLKECDIVYRATRLCEVSAVSLPSNPGTLTLSVERGAPLLSDAELEPAFRNRVHSGWYCVEEIATGRIVGSYAELTTADRHVNFLNIKAIRAALALARHRQWHDQARRAAVPPRGA
jgi:hypothetical protein